MRASSYKGVFLKSLAACCALLLSYQTSAAEYSDLLNQLNEEQRQLLNDYRKPTLNVVDHSFLPADNAVSLVSFKLTANTHPMQGAAFQVGAQYRSWSISPEFNDAAYNTYSAEFTITTPLVKALDFSESIREKSELCPEKLIDKIVFNGAFNLNFAW